MGRGAEQKTYRRPTSKHMKRCSTKLIIRVIQIKATARYHFTSVRMPLPNKARKNERWQGCGEKGTLVHCWRERKLVSLLWKTSFPGGSVVKSPPANAGEARDVGVNPGLGRSPAVGNGNPLQYSCLGNCGQTSLTGNIPWGLKESETTEWPSMHALLENSIETAQNLRIKPPYI